MPETTSFFEHVYMPVRAVFAEHDFNPDWRTFLGNSVRPSELLKEDGPNPAAADGLDALRSALGVVSRMTGPGAAASVAAQGAAEAKLILAMAKGGTPENGWRRRAAALKMLRHFYRIQQGSYQSIWVYSSPYAWKRRLFSEVRGPARRVEAKLADNVEVFDAISRDNLQFVVDVALNAMRVVRLALVAAPGRTERIFRDWFDDGRSTMNDMSTIQLQLDAGLGRMIRRLSHRSLVMTDRPEARYATDAQDRESGSVSSGTGAKFPVINMSRSMLDSGIDKANRYMVVLTAIHEVGHDANFLMDHGYDTTGLKPGRDLTHARAMANADSWAYFVSDVAGLLPAAKKAELLN